MKVNPIESTTLDYLSYHSGRACSEEPVRRLESLVNEMSEALSQVIDDVGNDEDCDITQYAFDLTKTSLENLDKYNRG